jgi:hypothetical protein
MQRYTSLLLFGADICQLKDPSLFIENGFIGGEWVAAKNGKSFPVYGIHSASGMV